MKYAINEDFYNDVEKKLNRIAKKCKKHGNDFVFNIVGTEIRENKNGNAANKFIIIEVEGTAKINDWEFIATLDIHDGGNVIRRYNNEIEIPERFKHSENTCEHCGTKRNRKHLYLIRNVSTGCFKQVGGSCLSLYTSGLNMEYIAAYMDGITALEESNGVFSIGGARYYSIEDVLHYAYVITSKVGYMKSGYENDLSTKNLVCDMLTNNIYVRTNEDRVNMVNNDLVNHGYNVTFSVSDFATDTTDEVKNIIEYYATCDDNSEFIHNIKIILGERYVPYNYLGFICYLPCGYFKHIEREVERAKRKNLKHEHWGEIGKRYKNVTVEHIKFIAQFETVYGLMKIWNVILEDGTVLTWKTSKDIDGDCNTITFTVKEHGEYKGIKQTEITRCKIA